jgi:hypothetical protein
MDRDPMHAAFEVALLVAVVIIPLTLISLLIGIGFLLGVQYG